MKKSEINKSLEKSYLYEIKKEGLQLSSNHLTENAILIYDYETDRDKKMSEPIYESYAVWANKITEEIYLYMYVTNIKKDGLLGDAGEVEAYYFKTLAHLQNWVKEESDVIFYEKAKEYQITRSANQLDDSLSIKNKLTKINKI